MTRPKLVLFDIGSTLWSSPAEDPGALAHCYGIAQEIVLRCYGSAPEIPQLIEAVEGYFAEWEEIWRQDSSIVHQPPTSQFVAEALAKIGVRLPDELLQDFTDAVLDTSVFTAKVLPREQEMVTALGSLRERGLRLACVSNAFMGANVLDMIMTERGLGQHLEFTISSCELGFRKPHPFIYEAAVNRAGLSSAETVFVGDRLDADVEGPAKLGMRTVLTRQYRQEDPASARVKPDFVIEHLSELPGAIDDLLEG